MLYSSNNTQHLDKLKKLMAIQQDEGVGRYTLPPQTIKRRTTNLKTKNNQTARKLNYTEV